MFPIIPANSVTAASGNDEGIFGFGGPSPTFSSYTNLVSNTGVVASDTAGVDGGRNGVAATQYGGDKGIFGYGNESCPPNACYSNISNLVSNTGVVASDTAGVGCKRNYLAACSYGEDKGIFGYGYGDDCGTRTTTTNLVSNAGVVASDTSGVGTARNGLAACEYGDDKGIFGFGSTPSAVAYTNLVSNAGVVASDTAGVAGVTARGDKLGACGYDGDKGIFGFGTPGPTNITNLVSNTGVVASDQAATTGTSRYSIAATQYGGDKGIFGFGAIYGGTNVGMTNLVSNTGVVASDVAAVGTASGSRGACSFN